MSSNQRKNIHLNAYVFLGLAIIHFLGLFHMPENYYTLLRWLTFTGSIAVLTLTYKIEPQNTLNYISVIFYIIGVLWNPIFPIYLSVNIWKFFNFIVMSFSAFLAYSSFKLLSEQ